MSRVVNPFWQAKFLGATPRQNWTLNRSFNQTASAWREGAKRAAVGAAETAAQYSAVIPLFVEGSRTGYRIIKRQNEQRQLTKQRMSKRKSSGALVPVTWRDKTSYVQLEEKKDKGGKYVLRRTRRNYLLDSLMEKVRFRFGRVQDISANRGTYWLSNRTFDTSWRRMPVYILPLFGINQGGADVTGGGTGTTFSANTHFGMYELMLQDGATAPSPGQFQWRRVAGQDPTITTATNAWACRAVAPSDSSNPVLGRRALIDWTRIKLCIWGKTKNPSQIRVSLVKFLKRNYAIEDALNKAAGTSDCDADGNAFWAQRMKYLLNGHNAGYGRNNDASVMKTLKRWDIKINPIDAGAETSNSDARPHMKHLDLFNRWNRVLDYTVPTTGTLSNYTEIIAENRVPDISVGYSAYLNDPEQMVYLLVESVQPLADDTANSADPRLYPTDLTLTASFDVSVESSFSHIQKLTT